MHLSKTCDQLKLKVQYLNYRLTGLICELVSARWECSLLQVQATVKQDIMLST